MNGRYTFRLAVVLTLWMASSPVWGQGQAITAQADESKASQSVDTADNADATLKADVIEVKGAVEYAHVGADPLDAAAWKPVAEGMKLGVDTQIRTGIRSRCVLMFGDAPDQTVISLRRATLASIGDFRKTPDEQRIRIGLGYGAVRGGSSEGTLRSDVVIESTVATLAKRGTEGFQIEIEPMSGFFRISLAESGLVEAFSNETNRRKSVRPGEYATNTNIARMWINQDIFDRAVKFYEVESVSPADLKFLTRNTTGFSSLAPNGSGVFSFATRDRRRRDLPLTNSNLSLLQQQQLQTLLLQRLPVRRPEGNFGFGRTFRVLAPRSTPTRGRIANRFSVLSRRR